MRAARRARCPPRAPPPPLAAARVAAHRHRAPPPPGFSLGAALGGAVGFAYGVFAAVKYKHVLYVPISVLQMGGAFGFFLMCGTVIRCDELPQLPPPKREEAQ